MKSKIFLFAFLAAIMLATPRVKASDNRNRPYITDATVSEQLDFVIGQSSRWETYRVIPETWLNQLRAQTLDTLSLLKTDMKALQNTIKDKDAHIANLTNQIKEIESDYELAVAQRDSFSFMGMLMRKGLFVSFTIFLLIVMGTMVAITFLLFQRANLHTRKLNKDLTDTMNNFEEYRQEARRKQENLVIQHHKEIQKLKGLS